MNGRSRIESLESRVLLAADIVPVQNIHGESIATVTWQGQPAEMFAGRWILRLDGVSGTPAQQLATARQRVAQQDAAFEVVRHLGGDGFFHVFGPQQMQPATAHARLSGTPGYHSVSPDFRYEKDLAPNDPSFGSQWGLNNIGQFGGFPGVDIRAITAWDVNTGNNKVVIGISDTGVDHNHPDLSNNIWINAGEIPSTRMANLTDIDGDGLITFRDLQHPSNRGPFKANDVNFDNRITGADLLAPMVKDGSGNDTGAGGWSTGMDHDFNGYTDDLIGYNFFGSNKDPMDDDDHGTHVAGIAGAEGNNGIGISGVNWNATLLPLKVGGPAGISGAAGVAANFYINNLKIRGTNPVNVRAVNHSWGGTFFDPQMNFIVQQHNTNGIMTVASAGNNNSNNDAIPRYPAGYPQPNVIAVANLTRFNGRSSDSNYGANSVHLAAPGDDILSTVRTTHGSYTFFGGTSMASPMVAGAVGLIFAAAPNATLAQVKNAILSTVTPVPAFSGLTITGGRLNLQAALAVLAPPGQLAQPDLTSGSDTGISAADNITADNTPTFQGIAQAGLTIKLYASGALVGEEVVPPGNIYSITANPMADGVYDFTITASNANGEGAHSPPLQVTIDTAAPVPTGAFRYHNSPHSYRVTWNEDVAHAIADGDFGIINTGTSAAVSHAATHNGTTHVTTLAFPSNTVMDEGRYRLTVFASGAGGGIIDAAGNALADDVQLNFLFLLGDANNDGAVNLNDFNILATHFGQSGRDYSEGDFDYNGTVNLNDFNILASRFGQTLPAAPSTSGTSSPFGGSTRIGAGSSPGKGMSTDEDPVGDLLA